MSMAKMEAFIHDTINLLSHPPASDPITACGPAILRLLSSRPADLIRLAYDKLHMFPFSSVPTCWRRLHTDASIIKAASLVRQNCPIRDASLDSPIVGVGKACTAEVLTTNWVQEVVALLDMALIMTGAPLRQSLIAEFLDRLQAHIVAVGCSSKRQNIGNPKDSFATNIANPPQILHSILRSPMSLTQFEDHIGHPEPVPIIITSALEHWPALSSRSWKHPSYLLEKTLDGRRLVPVELGRSYTDEGWGQGIITFGEFMKRYMLLKGMGHEDKEVECNERMGYLAQHDLFAQIPSLRSDIAIPDFCYTEPPPPASSTSSTVEAGKQAHQRLDEPLLNAWFGPAGTVSPLHTDPYYNILCQVVGKKYIRLYAPSETCNLYPRGIEDGGVNMANTSMVDAEGDPERLAQEFPNFGAAEYVDCILEEGECLFIPRGWWHYVRSLTVSFSVSFWWD